jgi:glycosyltransferase involved in cell wall biosynthesis
MKKIVFLHPAYYEQSMGGAEYQISLLIAFLKNQNTPIEVYYIFEDQKSPLEKKSNIHLLPIKKVRLNKSFGNRWFLYKNKIKRHLDDIKPDIIYTRFFSSWSGIAAEYAKKNNCIHIWALASDSDIIRIQKKVPFLKPLDRIENKWVKKAFANASFILTQNNYQQELLRSIHNREGILIKQSNVICAENLINKSNAFLNIYWIANLKPLKQPQLFVELANRFKNISAIHFKMIGRSQIEYTELIQNAIDTIPNFDYLGELSNDEVNEQLCEAHILVNTSEYEGFSNTFVQAWMRNVVVVSLNSNPDEILTKQQIGFLTGNIDEMEKVMNGLNKDPIRRSKLGQKAREYAIENHSYDKNMSMVLKLMKINE